MLGNLERWRPHIKRQSFVGNIGPIALSAIYLPLSVYFDHALVVKELGASVEAANGAGGTPAHLAAENGHDGCLRTLKETRSEFLPVFEASPVLGGGPESTARAAPRRVADEDSMTTSQSFGSAGPRWPGGALFIFFMASMFSPADATAPRPTRCKNILSVIYNVLLNIITATSVSFGLAENFLVGFKGQLWKCWCLGSLTTSSVTARCGRCAWLEFR